eukprot:scaffold225_cov111-Isochrysis_galbana.AAC.4
MADPSTPTISRHAGASAASREYDGTVCTHAYGRKGGGGRASGPPRAEAEPGASQMALRLSGMKGRASEDSLRAPWPGGITAPPSTQPKSAAEEVKVRCDDHSTSTRRKSHERYSPTSTASKAMCTSTRPPGGSSAPPPSSGGSGSASRKTASAPSTRTARSRAHPSTDPLITSSESFSEEPLSTTPKLRVDSDTRTPRTGWFSADCTSDKPSTLPLLARASAAGAPAPPSRPPSIALTIR